MTLNTKTLTTNHTANNTCFDVHVQRNDNKTTDFEMIVVGENVCNSVVAEI